MPKIIPFVLKPKDLKILEEFMSRGEAKARQYRRAEILMMLHNGLNTEDIRKMFGIPWVTVARIRDLYNEQGLDRAIYDFRRSGRPKKFDASQRAKITALACTKPPEGRARWSLTLLRDQIVKLEFVHSISRAQVARILKKTK